VANLAGRWPDVMAQKPAFLFYFLCVTVCFWPILKAVEGTETKLLWM
jgi:nitrate reductase NapE component